MPLADADRTLLRLSVAICLGDWALVRALRRDAPEGAPDRGWREAVLQAHLFAGFPRVVEACGVLAEEGGLGAPEPDEARYEPDGFPAGRALFERIYGGKTELVRGKLEAAHPVLARWIEGHVYGRVLARGGLSPAQREALAVACLAASGQDRQLASHARGALAVGASPEDLREALDAVADLIGDDKLRHAQRIVDRFAPL